MIFVVGSGPAGVSCASALLKQGVQVTLLDPGLELDSEASDRIVKLKGLGPEKWQPQDLAFMKAGTSADIGGIPLKYAYGSDFPYRDPGADWRLEMDGVDSRPSFAKGGLSTVWGAAILPFRANEIRDWPITEHELACHYRAVLEFMPLAGRHDSLEKSFPLYTAFPQPLACSSQATAFLGDLGSAANELEREGILFGQSRLAMWAQANHRGPGCLYCTQCMYGCPYGVIYSSSHTLDVLREHPNFIYRKDVLLERVEENGDKITLFARELKTRGQLQLRGSRVFLACGVLATTKILLESLDAFDQPLTLQDASYFLLPLLRYRSTSDSSSERVHTLAQAFLEILDPQICDQAVHLQIYAYNELYSLALKKLFGPTFPLLKRPTKMLLDRQLLVQGFLPSAYSPSIRTTLSKDPRSGVTCLHLTPVSSNRTEPLLRKVVRKLRRNQKYLRAIPLSPILRMGRPGRSFHSGGTFPMQVSPGQFQSDRFGRPYGFKRVHAVDSTIFPSIPATTITLSIMANASRIGSSIGDY